jgi:hypothetical protein
LIVAGCAGPGALLGQTPGERFRAYMAKMDADCRKAELGPYRPANASLYQRSNASCDILLLKPRDWKDAKFVKVEGQPLPVPEEWVATEEGRFAHSIKLPIPLSADSGYKPGMTSEDYFKHLCEKEAGEFVYKTVENVEGVLQMRPRLQVTDYMRQHLYAIEDPIGENLVGGDSAEVYVQPFMGKYSFLELPMEVSKSKRQGDKHYLKYFRDSNASSGKSYQTSKDGFFVNVAYIVNSIGQTSVQSKFGYIWRGIVRPNDRWHGISGGELIVLNLSTNEILAVRRNFAQTGAVKYPQSGVWWMGASKCTQQTMLLPSGVVTAKPEHIFLYGVLKPVPTINESIRGQ